MDVKTINSYLTYFLDHFVSIAYTSEYGLGNRHTTLIGRVIMTLIKADIVNAVVEENGFSKKRAINTVETLLEILKDTLASGEDVLVSGFGKFCVNQKRERRGRNPANGENLMLTPRKVVKFRCFW